MFRGLSTHTNKPKNCAYERAEPNRPLIQQTNKSSTRHSIPSICFGLPSPFKLAGSRVRAGISIVSCQRSHRHCIQVLAFLFRSGRNNKQWHFSRIRNIFHVRYAKHRFNWLMTETNGKLWGETEPHGMLRAHIPDCCWADRHKCIVDVGEKVSSHMCRQYSSRANQHIRADSVVVVLHPFIVHRWKIMMTLRVKEKGFTWFVPHKPAIEPVSCAFYFSLFS